jgi:energy-coupling factor transport system ATP-binding protein
VDLALYPGEIMVLVGPNGAGKSTLLRALVGLVRARKGRIRVTGQDIAGWDTAEICRRVGYLPQDPNTLLFAETVLDELKITLRNHGLPLDGDNDMDASSMHAGWSPTMLLSALGLQEKASAYPRDLSAGERQRVALGAVMIPRPGALLLDEPTRGLDYIAKHGLLDLLRGWRESGMAVLLVTHDVELAAAAADRAVLLEQGQVKASGSPAEVLGRSPHFAPQMAQLFPESGRLTVEDVMQSIKHESLP